MSRASQTIAVLIVAAPLLAHPGPFEQNAVAQPGEQRRLYKPFVEFSVPEFSFRAGSGPDEQARFVSDYFAEEPYTGALRDTRSVLVTRAGNSLDLSRFLLRALSRPPDYTRLVSFGQSTFPLTSSSFAAEQPDLLGSVAASALRDAVALGDAMESGGRITVPGSRKRDSEYQRYGVQIREGGTWRTIYGSKDGNGPVLPLERTPASDVNEITFRIDAVYSSPAHSAPTTLNVFNATLTLEDVVFWPLWLDFTVSGKSAKAVLHGLREKDGFPRVITGSEFPIETLSVDPQQNLANGSEHLIEDVRLTLAHGGRQPVDRSFSLKPPSAEVSSTDWRGKLFTSLHVLSIATGTPSIDYLVKAVDGNALGDEMRVATAFHAVHMMYLVLRSHVSASPYIAESQRVLTGPNVFTTSIYSSDGRNASDEVVMNLASKHYELMGPAGAAGSFGDRLWNGFVDHEVEKLLFSALGDTQEPGCAARIAQPRRFRLTGPGQPLPNAVSSVTAERLKQQMARGVVIAYSDAPCDQRPAKYWIIEVDGTVEDWDRWDRHQDTIGRLFLWLKQKRDSSKLWAMTRCALLLGMTITAPRLSAAAVLKNADPAVQVMAEIAKGMASGSGKSNSQSCKFSELAKQLGSQGGSASRPKRKKWW